MLIVDNTKLDKINFEDLTVGDIFKSENDDPFMKIDIVRHRNNDSTFNCVCLVDGELAYFDICDKVTQVNAVVSLDSTEML